VTSPLLKKVVINELQHRNNMKQIHTAIIIFCTASLSFAGAGGSKHGHDNTHWDAPAFAKAQSNPITYTQSSRQQGEDIFIKNCASCHGVTGLGDGPLSSTIKPRPTDLRTMSGKHKDGDFAWKISTGKGTMPAWKGILKRSEIWHLVNYIQTLSLSVKVTQKKTKHERAQTHGH